MNIWEDNSTVDYENEDKTEIAFASLNRLVQLVTSPQGFQYLRKFSFEIDEIQHLYRSGF
jgi:hypothetical protein